jgi:hypothetical protein
MLVSSRSLLGAPSCLLLALIAGCSAESSFNAPSVSAHAKGVRDAMVATKAGSLKLKEYPPLPSPAYQGEYISLLKERCGVDYEAPTLPPGVSEADFIQEVRGWNETMEPEIQRKFGPDILTRLQEEAEKRWRGKIHKPDKE